MRAGDAAGAFTGGSDGSPVVADDVVPTGGSTGVFALDHALFPRFNMLCLPGLTSDDQVQIGDALSYCQGERAFLVVDSPTGGFAAIPPALGTLAGAGRARRALLPAPPGDRARAGRDANAEPPRVRRGRRRDGANRHDARHLEGARRARGGDRRDTVANPTGHSPSTTTCRASSTRTA